MGAAILSKVRQFKIDFQEHVCAVLWLVHYLHLFLDLIWQHEAAKIVTTCFGSMSGGSWYKHADGSQ